MNSPPELPSIPEDTLAQLFEAGQDVWDEFRAHASERFHRFIPCDGPGAYEALRRLRGRASTFIELGSAAGVVTILADLLGFDAYAIEIEPLLVERSIELARQFDSSATFVEGSFVPPDYQDEVEHLSPHFVTLTAGARAYEELGLELDDFDLVYVYPWPDEQDWLDELMRRYRREGALLLTYDACEGYRVSQADPRSPRDGDRGDGRADPGVDS